MSALSHGFNRPVGRRRPADGRSDRWRATWSAARSAGRSPDGLGRTSVTARRVCGATSGPRWPGSTGTPRRSGSRPPRSPRRRPGPGVQRPGRRRPGPRSSCSRVPALAALLAGDRARRGGRCISPSAVRPEPALAAIEASSASAGFHRTGRNTAGPARHARLPGQEPAPDPGSRPGRAGAGSPAAGGPGARAPGTCWPSKRIINTPARLHPNGQGPGDLRPDRGPVPRARGRERRALARRGRPDAGLHRTANSSS